MGLMDFNSTMTLGMPQSLWSSGMSASGARYTADKAKNEKKSIFLKEKKHPIHLVKTNKKQTKPIELQEMQRKLANKNNPMVVDADCDLTAEQLNSIIKKLIERRGESNVKNNPLLGKGQVFIDKAKKYGVNPLAMLAIAMQESGRGSSSAIRVHNNIGGIMKKGKIWHFNSIDESIEKQAMILATRCKEGLNTIEALGASGKYCAENKAGWIKAVRSFSNEIKKYMKE